MNKMFPYCRILYKLTDEPGWILGQMNGDKATVEGKCLAQKWYKYIIYDGSSCSWEIEDKYPVDIEPYDMHLRTNWLFSNELNKIFLPEENIPTPKSNAIFSDEFRIKFIFEQEDNDINDLVELLEEKIKYRRNVILDTYPEITFELNRITFSISVEYSTDIDERFESFIDKIRNDLFAYLIIDEYNYTKLLSWSDGINCRFKVQNYDEYNAVFEPIDAIINKDVLLNVLVKFKTDILNEHKKYIELVNTMNKKNI